MIAARDKRADRVRYAGTQDRGLTTHSRPVLLLTREEMYPLAECLVARGFGCLLVDGPGFGHCARGRLGYGPQLYREFLADFTAACVPSGEAVIAAGHAAAFALMLARDQPGVWSRAVLLAPSWRGPLPTAVGGHP